MSFIEKNKSTVPHIVGFSMFQLRSPPLRGRFVKFDEHVLISDGSTTLRDQMTTNGGLISHHSLAQACLHP